MIAGLLLVSDHMLQVASGVFLGFVVLERGLSRGALRLR